HYTGTQVQKEQRAAAQTADDNAQPDNRPPPPRLIVEQYVHRTADQPRSGQTDDGRGQDAGDADNQQSFIRAKITREFSQLVHKGTLRPTGPNSGAKRRVYDARSFTLKPNGDGGLVFPNCTSRS